MEDPGAVRQDRDQIIAEHGRWTASNIDLGGGVYTMADVPPRPTEQRTHRIVQAAADLSGRPLDGMRVLDLGFYEGSFALALAMHGATVVGVEGREEHVVKARFAARTLGLHNTDFQVGDVRDVTVETHGTFDVVLCLGLLYHLTGDQACALVEELARMATRLAVVEGQVSLSDDVALEHRGRTYHGRHYGENVAQPLASLVNHESFWFTRASLLNLLLDVGFSSVCEILAPVVSSVMAIRDHVAYVAIKGSQLERRSLPPSPTAYDERVPEHLPRFAHPTQGWRYRLEERWRRRSGGGAPSMFRPSA